VTSFAERCTNNNHRRDTLEADLLILDLKLGRSPSFILSRPCISPRTCGRKPLIDINAMLVLPLASAARRICRSSSFVGTRSSAMVGCSFKFPIFIRCFNSTPLKMSHVLTAFK
jgi:hypothetical protein